MLRPAAIVIAILVAAPAGLAAQQPVRLADVPPPRFASWAPAFEPGAPPLPTVPTAPHRLRHGLIGGAVGAVTGFAVCTAIANLVADKGSAFTTCPADTSALFAGGGFIAGFTVGWVL